MFFFDPLFILGLGSGLIVGAIASCITFLVIDAFDTTKDVRRD